MIRQKSTCALFMLIVLVTWSSVFAHAEDPVVLQLKWFHQFQFAGYYAALEQGYYRDEGLDVTLRAGGPAVDVAREVLSGRANYGILASELIELRANGEPVVLLAPIMQHSIRTLIVLSDSDIFFPKDLVGQPMMLKLGEEIEFAAMFAVEGVSLDQLIILPKDESAMEQLIEGRIVAMNGSVANQPFTFWQLGFPVRLITPFSHGIDFYGDSLFTSEDELRDYPERAAGFRRASLKGWEYALDNPDEIISLIIAKYNSDKERPHLEFEAEELEKLIIRELVELGHASPDRVNRIAAAYADLSLGYPPSTI